MSLQVFLQARILGAEQFLSAPPAGDHQQADWATEFVGKSAWLALLGEVLPRTLLATFKLSRMLLGSSSAEQFLLVLPEDEVPRANEFLDRAAASIALLSADTVRLVWSTTENLGAWEAARKRLEDGLSARSAAPLRAASQPENLFQPFGAPSQHRETSDYFLAFGKALPSASKIGSEPDRPGRLIADGGYFSWALVDHVDDEQEGVLFPRRFATNDEGTAPATLSELGERAEGSPKWGVLRGDVDLFEARLRRAGSIEDHLQLSVMFKQFFAGELALQCTYPEFWRKVTVLYRGGDDFAVAGTWDALILLARELQRLFEKFVEQSLAGSAGVEAKTISMALAIAPDEDASLAELFAEAGNQLYAAKVAQSGTFFVLGRALEWPRLEDAEELKSALVRLAKDFDAGREFIQDLTSVYRESFAARSTRRSRVTKVERPWRTYMRVSQVLPEPRGKESLNLRAAIITNLLGKKATGLKLRPSARVGLEWARLAAGETAKEK